MKSPLPHASGLPVALFSVLISLSLIALAHDGTVAVAGGDASNTTCPIGHEPIDGETFVTHSGHTIGFCCPGCDDAFSAWSTSRKDDYIAKLAAGEPDADRTEPQAPASPESAAKPSEPWTDPYPLRSCIVSNLELGGSMGEPVIQKVEGREIRFCCGGCIPTFEKDPAKYWKKIDDILFNDQLRYYPLDRCVVTGDPLKKDGKDTAHDVIIGNRLFRLASPKAEATLRKDPRKYVAELDKAAKKAQREGYPLDTCPVSKAKLGSMGKPVAIVIAGRRIDLCCESCVAKAHANPAPILEQLDRAWNAKGKFQPPTTSRPMTSPRKEN